MWITGNLLCWHGLAAETCPRSQDWPLTGSTSRAGFPARVVSHPHAGDRAWQGSTDGCGLDKTRLCTTLPELSYAAAAHVPPRREGAFNFPNLLNFKEKCGLAKFWPHSGKPHGHAAKVPLQAWHAQTYPQDVWIRADLLCRQRLAEFPLHRLPGVWSTPLRRFVGGHSSGPEWGLTETGCAHPSLNRHIPDDGSHTGLHCRNVSRPSH